MIDQVMDIIRTEVNSYVADRVGDTSGANRVVLTSFVDESGKTLIPADTVGLSLLNIEEEKTLKQAGLVPTSTAEVLTEFVQPPVRLNLQMMFTTNFTNYAEGLKHISYILAFFQRRPWFDLDNTPSLRGKGTSKLIFELNTLGLEQQHYIWSMIGLRYLPSVIYRVRMLIVLEEDIAAEVVNIREIHTSTKLKKEKD